MPRLSTVLFWGFWAFVLWFIVSNPVGAASVWHGIAGGLSHAAHSMSTFLTNAVR